MQLYAGLSSHFCRDPSHNQIAEKLRTAFFRHYRYEPPPSEVNSWRNSLRAMADVLEEGGLDDHGVMLDDTVVKRAKGAFVDLVHNTYRVLLTCGMKACFVCFVDKDTERFVRSRVE